MKGRETSALVTVRGFILRDSKILAVRRSSNAKMNSNLWEVPGGKLDTGQTIKEALHREIEEETGMVITLVDSLFHECSYLQKGPGKVRTRVVLFGLGKIEIPKRVILSSEHTAFRWCSYHELLTLDLRKETREAAVAMRRRIAYHAR